MVDVMQYNGVENRDNLIGPGGELDEFESGDNSAKLFERSRIKALADERQSVQKKTFCKWVNMHLARVGCKILDLYIDLSDGKMLMKLLEVLSGDRLPRPTRGRMRIHCVQNVNIALAFLEQLRVHMENMGAQDIVDGNPRLILGLIWTIILRFQIQDITVTDEGQTAETKSAKDALMLWCQMKTAGYPNVNIRNFTTSWRDGLAFNALIHKHRPDLIEFQKLQKSNPIHNLNNAFDVAEDKLGLTKLLDAEDLTMDTPPDEKSVITYVVTYYHYFSKMKAESVHAKRIGKVVNQALDAEQMVDEYERCTSDLLEWIEKKIDGLNDREFANSLHGVQQQLVEFSTYRNVEKPPKFTEKGNLEVKLFTIQSKMRANNQKPYMPTEGKMLSDINRAWEKLERAEHGRELALREELIRQEKLEQLASRFDRKAGLRETWLSENQRLVSQDNFGYDLAAVEAATKKHEAIETDIKAYEERVTAVVAVGNELAEEKYHDIKRIDARKDNVLRLWKYLLELLAARRKRLDLSLEIQKIFQEMLDILDWIDELKTRLASEDYGKHLMGVTDLIQKHDLLVADIHVVGDRVNTANDKAKKFVDCQFPQVGDYKPVDPKMVTERIAILEKAYKELLDSSEGRLHKLEDSRRMWQFYWDITAQENWIKETKKLMSSPDLGHDLTSVHTLINNHKAIESELKSQKVQLDQAVQVGKDLINDGNFASEKIKDRIGEIEAQWSELEQLSDYRKRRLHECIDRYQFFADADDINTWMVDTLRLVMSDDLGHDEPSVHALLRKHQKVMDDLDNFDQQIQQLHEQAAALGDEDRQSPDVEERLAVIDRRYKELLELAKNRKQRLLDALALFKLFSEADWVEAWIKEREEFLKTLTPGLTIDDLAVVKHSFERFERDMNANASKVAIVNQLARQLLQAEHPDSDQIIARQNRLNHEWSNLRDIVDLKREELNQANRSFTFHIECQETVTWIQEKMKLLESTDELGNDLAGVMARQRRLSTLEGDLDAIQSKLNYLDNEAKELVKEKPDEATEVDEKQIEIKANWGKLKQMIKERDEKLGEADELQKFLQSLDHFQAWLSRTQTAIASQDTANNLAEAEKLLNQHDQIKEEIDAYAPDYRKSMEYGAKLIEGQEDDPQFMLLKQRLAGLTEGWNELQAMWDKQKEHLDQGLHLQMFNRDVKQAEVILKEQESFLNKQEAVPALSLLVDRQGTLDAAETALKQHEQFMTTMDASDEKLNGVVSFADKLVDEGHYASDRIAKKAEEIRERRDAARARAQEQLKTLRDQIELQQFLQDCDELQDWLQEKMIAAQDETYRDAKNIHSKYVRHQAFEAEIAANKERLTELQQAGEKLINEHPETTETVQPRLDELQKQWDELDSTTKEKGQKLFDANRPMLYEQSCKDIDEWMDGLEKQIVEADLGSDLTTVNLLMQKQNLLEKEMQLKAYQVGELEKQGDYLTNTGIIEPEKQEQIFAQRANVENKFQKLKEPLEVRRLELEKVKRVHQFFRDVEDEKLWIAEKLPIAQSQEYGNNLQNVEQLLKKNKALRNDVETHERHIDALVATANEMIAEDHPQTPEFKKASEDLQERWKELKDALDARRARLELSETAQLYYHDAGEAESWMSEQELFMMSEDRAKDEQGAQNMVKKHQAMERAIHEFADTVRQLGERSRKLIEDDHPDSDQMALRQSQVDKLYAGLKDLANERAAKVDEVLKLYLLNREIEDIEQWIAERSVVAGSHELGQDFEHVCMLQDRFNDFAEETESTGEQKVNTVNGQCDQQIASGHSDAATIAEWKDMINEAWQDLLELMETRKAHLQASYELHKFFHDCKETLERILEKQLLMPSDFGRDANSVAALQRKHTNFEHDLQAIGSQVQAIQEEATRLQAAYAGDRAQEIKDREMEVVNAWRNLHILCDARRQKLTETADLFRFFNMVRDLLFWMDDIIRQMKSSEKPKDVSGVELLMNNHQGLRAEIDARDDNFMICVALGRDLIKRHHYRESEVREKLFQLANQRGLMMEQWEERWEYLQLILEVYQFARDAAVAEAWILAHQQYLSATDLGDTLDEVEKLIKKHEAFEKSLLAQEERFMALGRLTTYELKEEKRRERGGPSPKPSFRQKFIEEFVPPEEVQAPPEPEIKVTSPEEKKPRPAEPEGTQTKDDPLVTSTPLTTRPHQQAAADAAEKTPPSRRRTSKPTPTAEEPSKAEQIKKELPKVEVHHEGVLSRKHEWESTAKKASSRSWDKVYSVLHQNSFSFYKDQKHAKTDPLSYFHKERPLELVGGSAELATDYKKKAHVFRLKLVDGAEYLFQCKDDDERNVWLAKFQTIAEQQAAAAESGGPGTSKTLPATSRAGGPSSASPVAASSKKKTLEKL